MTDADPARSERRRTVFRTTSPLLTGHAAADPYWRADIWFSGGQWRWGYVGTGPQLVAAAEWCAERNWVLA